MNKLLYTAVITSATLLSAACASSETETKDGRNWELLSGTTGEELFFEKCGMCHADAIGMGTGILARRYSAELALLENRTDLQPVFVETVVRNGFGIMLPISRAEVSNEQLTKISHYLAEED